MSRFIQKLKVYFYFSRGELRGITAFIILIFIILVFPYFIRLFSRNIKSDFSEFERQIENFEKMNAENQQINKPVIQKKNKSDNFIIELNSADSLELMRLRGIGPAFARKIIRYRNLLGGYCSKDQLLEVWGMDHNRYDMIKPHIIVNPDSVHKININISPFKKLLRHPYFNYEIARGIIEYRHKHGDFIKIDDLLKIPSVNDSVYHKLIPYVKLH